jgi:hypothetical protein
MPSGREGESRPHRFNLGWCDRKIGWYDPESGSMQTPRRFLDYIVDGESLYERNRLDLISCLGWLVPDEDELAAQRLLLIGAPDVEDRVSIYLCPECGDVYCGALTAIIERSGDEVVWRDIAHSRFDWLAERWEHEALPHFGELRFDAGDYLTAIRKRTT